MQSGIQKKPGVVRAPFIATQILSVGAGREVLLDAGGANLVKLIRTTVEVP